MPKILTIDNDLRKITIPDTIKNLGVESDDDVLRLHFSIPRMYGTVDLADFDIRINYMNAGNESDVYVVADKYAEPDAITFSWLVDRTVAAYKGNVKFIVCLKLLSEDGIVVKEFNTTVATLPVLEGLETSEKVVQQNPDVLEQILRRLDALEQNGTGGGSGSDSSQNANGLTTAQINALDGMFKVCAFTKADVSAEYSTFKTAFGLTNSGGGSGGDSGSGDSGETEVALTGISATYAGGDVTVGTALADLSGIVVTAHYSDGSSETVNDYTLSGEITEGENTVTVTYQSKNATFTVTGVAESGDGDSGSNPFDTAEWLDIRITSAGKEYTGHAGYTATDYLDASNINSITVTALYAANTTYTIVYFDSDKNAVETGKDGYIALDSTSYPESVTYEKPAGAVYCRVGGTDTSVLGTQYPYEETVRITVA